MSFRSVQSSAGDVSNQLQDSISGMRLIQSFIIDLLNNIGLVAVIVFGVWQVMEGEFTSRQTCTESLSVHVWFHLKS